MTDKPFRIPNSTAEFPIYTAQAGAQGIEVQFEDETVCLTQKVMAELFDVDVCTVSEHLGNILDSKELQRDSLIRKFRISDAAIVARMTVVKNSLTTAATAAHCGRSPEGTPACVLPTGWVSR